MTYVFKSLVLSVLLIGYVLFRDKMVKDVYIYLCVGCLLLLLVGV